MKENRQRKALVAGGSGLIGSHLCRALAERGYEVTLLSRSSRNGGPFPVVQWDPGRQFIAGNELPSCNVLVNLSGASIAGKRWSTAYKKVLRDSRVDSATFLNQLVQNSPARPEVFIGASAIGYYGNSGREPVGENVQPATGFLGDLSRDWEAAHLSPEFSDVRKVVLRIGLVLTPEGGTLEPILAGARFGMYPTFGNGSQYMSWIHIADMVGMIRFLIENPGLNGPFNAVAPHPVTNKAFLKAVHHAKGGPGVFPPTPLFALKIGLGEFANVLFDSCNVSVQKIMDAGYEFKFPSVAEALDDLI